MVGLHNFTRLASDNIGHKSSLREIGMEYLCESEENIIVRIRGQQGRRSRHELQFLLLLLFSKRLVLHVREDPPSRPKKKKVSSIK